MRNSIYDQRHSTEFREWKGFRRSRLTPKRAASLPARYGGVLFGPRALVNYKTTVIASPTSGYLLS
jgi:hypothetical protein